MYLKNVKRFLRFFSTILIWSEAVETAADISVEIMPTNVDFSLWVQYTFKHLKLHCRETDDLKWSGSDHDLDHYLARKDRIVAHIFENGKG